MKKKGIVNIVIVVVLLVIVPVLLSVIIHFPKLSFVAGDENTWIVFWGSYIGALITLLALFITVQTNQKEEADQRIIDFNKQYARDITIAVCSLSITKILDCYNQNREKQLIESVDVIRLTAYKQEISNAYNSFVVLYPDADESFLEQYEKSENLFIEFINTLVKNQNFLEKRYNNYYIEDTIKQNTAYAISTHNLEDTYYELWKVAQKAISQLRFK